MMGGTAPAQSTTSVSRARSSLEATAHSSRGTSPTSWFAPSCTSTSVWIFPSSVGTVPVSWFIDRSKTSSRVSWPSSDGTVPVRGALVIRFNLRSADKSPSSLGSVPDRKQLSKSISSRLGIKPSSVGTFPKTKLFARLRLRRLGRAKNSIGIVPDNPLFASRLIVSVAKWHFRSQSYTL